MGGTQSAPYEQENGNFHHKGRQSLLIQSVLPKPTLPLRVQKTMGRDCRAPSVGKWKTLRPELWELQSERMGLKAEGKTCSDSYLFEFQARTKAWKRCLSPSMLNYTLCNWSVPMGASHLVSKVLGFSVPLPIN